MLALGLSVWIVDSRGLIDSVSGGINFFGTSATYVSSNFYLSCTQDSHCSPALRCGNFNI